MIMTESKTGGRVGVKADEVLFEALPEGSEGFKTRRPVWWRECPHYLADNQGNPSPMQLMSMLALIVVEVLSAVQTRARPTVDRLPSRNRSCAYDLSLTGLNQPTSPSRWPLQLKLKTLRC